MKFNLISKLDVFWLDESTRILKSTIIADLSKQLNGFINKKDYGSGINELEIIIYIIKHPKGYEILFKNITPKFSETHQYLCQQSGKTIVVNNHFSYSIKLEGDLFLQFIYADESESKNILFREVLKSFSVLKQLQNSICDFNFECFQTDMEKFYLHKI